MSQRRGAGFPLLLCMWMRGVVTRLGKLPDGVTSGYYVTRLRIAPVGFLISVCLRWDGVSRAWRDAASKMSVGSRWARQSPTAPNIDISPFREVPMLRTLLSAAIILITAATLTTTVDAQVLKIRGTGCSNAPYPTTVGSPTVGQGFGVIAAPARTAGGQSFLVFGTAGANLTLPAPPACARNCKLEWRPLLVLYQEAVRFMIPRDRSLIGMRFCAQSGAIEAVRPNGCVYLHGALGITIQ